MDPPAIRCDTEAMELVAAFLVVEAGRSNHVREVVRRAQEWFPEHSHVGAAAALHDVGYAQQIQRTGMHALDGAQWCADHGVPDAVVELVAWHTGAWYEAVERGLVSELERYARPDQVALDALTLCDLTSSPTGEEVDVTTRLDEILGRYGEEHPVHRAVTRSREELQLSCRRAIGRLGLAEGWGLTSV